MRDKIILVCSKCLNRNYSTTKKKSNSTRMEIMKYCPHCNAHTLHKQTK